MFFSGRTRGGFTLIEVLLVCTLFASLGLAVFTCLSNGLKLWQRANKLSTQEDIVFFLEKFGQDTRNSFVISQLEVKGTELSFAFPSRVLVPSGTAEDGGPAAYTEQPGLVEYSYEPQGGVIFRRQADYGQALKGQFGPSQQIAAQVDGVYFRYFHSGSRDPVSAVSGQGLPSAVEVEVRCKDSGGEREFKRMFLIPAGV
jgi:prepilin-type N-terminal cleavage/methylation domain-containing protein